MDLNQFKTLNSFGNNNAVPNRAAIELTNLQIGANRLALARGSPQDIAASAGEHEAFARYAVNRNLIMAPALAVATPLYALAKLAKENSTIAGDFLNRTGLVNSDATPPSMAQVMAGWGGIASGLGDRALQAKQGVLNFFAPNQPTR
jgi:hypothetical protein